MQLQEAAYYIGFLRKQHKGVSPSTLKAVKSLALSIASAPFSAHPSSHYSDSEPGQNGHWLLVLFLPG